MRIGTIVVVIWLIIGFAATLQRSDYTTGVHNCSKAATIVVTIIAGPLNYVGVNPKIACKTPQPSK
jgi:hypothetical protein